MAFWSQSCLSELIFDGLFDPLQHTACSNLLFGITSSDQHYGKNWAPCTKSKLKGDWLLFMDSCCTCSTFSAIKLHLWTSASIPSNSPLLAFETLNGHYSPMCQEWFLSCCNAIWSTVALSPLQGHSFRIGATTHLLLLGVDPYIVTVQGCQSSSMFLLYWWNCEEIIPLFIGFSLES